MSKYLEMGSTNLFQKASSSKIERMVCEVQSFMTLSEFLHLYRNSKFDLHDLIEFYWTARNNSVMSKAKETHIGQTLTFSELKVWFDKASLEMDTFEDFYSHYKDSDFLKKELEDFFNTVRVSLDKNTYVPAHKFLDLKGTLYPRLLNRATASDWVLKIQKGVIKTDKEFLEIAQNPDYTSFGLIKFYWAARVNSDSKVKASNTVIGELISPYSSSPWSRKAGMVFHSWIHKIQIEFNSFDQFSFYLKASKDEDSEEFNDVKEIILKHSSEFSEINLKEFYNAVRISSFEDED